MKKHFNKISYKFFISIFIGMNTCGFAQSSYYGRAISWIYIDSFHANSLHFDEDSTKDRFIKSFMNYLNPDSVLTFGKEHHPTESHDIKREEAAKYTLDYVSTISLKNSYNSIVEAIQKPDISIVKTIKKEFGASLKRNLSEIVLVYQNKAFVDLIYDIGVVALVLELKSPDAIDMYIAYSIIH